jgi:uncharacterized protein
VNQIGRPVQVRATNYDGSHHWSHPAYLVMEKGSLVVTQTFAGTSVETENGPWVSPFHTRGHYWTDRYYNVIRLDAPSGGGFQGFYCNIATPAEFDGESLHYTDLQLDVRVYVEDAGLRPEVMDEDEFEAACRKYAYAARLIERARSALAELLSVVERREFPFNA